MKWIDGTNDCEQWPEKALETSIRAAEQVVANIDYNWKWNRKWIVLTKWNRKCWFATISARLKSRHRSQCDHGMAIIDDNSAKHLWTGYATVAFALKLNAVFSIYSLAIPPKDGEPSRLLSCQKAVPSTDYGISASIQWKVHNAHAVPIGCAVFFSLLFLVSVWSSTAGLIWTSTSFVNFNWFHSTA